MWIELDDSLIAIGNPTVAQTQTLQTLCNAAFAGRHILSGSRKVLQWLQSAGLGTPATAVLRRAINKRATMAGLKKELIFSLRVIRDPVALRCENGEWQVSLSCLQDNSFAKTEILGEHVRDSELCAIAGEHYRLAIGLRGVRLAAVKGSGGGSAIDAVFRQRLVDKFFVVAIVDSDKIYPSARQSVTSRTCMEIYSDARWPCFFAEIPCRDMENLLPTNLVEDAFADGRYAALHPAISRLKEIWTASPEVYRHLDVKDGSKAYCGRSGSAGSDLRKFWDDGIGKICPGNAFCAECPAAKMSDCKCDISCRLGERVLDTLLEYFRNRSIHETYKRASTAHNFLGWIGVGKIAFDCAIADEPVRT